MSGVAQQKKTVEQLRVEFNMQRKPVSECVKDMMTFMDDNNGKDLLLNGFTNKKDNPFMEKGGCTIL